MGSIFSNERFERPGGVRHLIERIFTPSEAADLAGEICYLDFNDPRLAGVLGQIRDRFPISTEKPGYCRVEHKPDGHPWHTDKGAGGHMAWCEYSASVLLTPPDAFTGGGLYFKDLPDVPVHHYLDLWVWDDAAENGHRVMRHGGNRRSLIMFFGAVDG